MSPMLLLVLLPLLIQATYGQGWFVPEQDKIYSLSMKQALEFKTTENRKAHLSMHFTPKPSDTNTWLFFRLSCSEPQSNKWTFVVYHCMPNSKDTYVLTGAVPMEAEKVWTITRTLTQFTVHCNGVLVLNFNYQSDYEAGYSPCQSVWSRETTGVELKWAEEMYEAGYIYMRINGHGIGKEQCSSLPDSWTNNLVTTPTLPVFNGENVTVSCTQDNFKLSGDNVITCTKEQQWEYSDAPVCLPSTDPCQEEKEKLQETLETKAALETELTELKAVKAELEVANAAFEEDKNKLMVQLDDVTAASAEAEAALEADLRVVKVELGEVKAACEEDKNKLKKELDDVTAASAEAEAALEAELEEVKAESAECKAKPEKQICPGEGIWSIPKNIMGKKITKKMLKKWKKGGEKDNIRYLSAWSGAKMTNDLARYIECFLTKSEAKLTERMAE